MSVIDSSQLLATGDEGYQISRSVRLRSSASAYFSRTLTTPTNNKIFTWSGWLKLGNFSNGYGMFCTTLTTSPRAFFVIDANTLWFLDQPSGTNASLNSSAVLRDPSAWYHIVFAVDTTQATSTNRVKMYINGVQATLTGTYPTQNTNPVLNSATAHTVGSYATNYFDGYLTEVNFIDGQALTPSSFGQNDPVTGVWGPKRYSGSYGTNGFYLNFSDNSAATAAAIGKDYSGNGNNWTPNNISLTAGVTYDSMIDVPTLYADGGTGRGNYCTLSPLQIGPYAALSAGNLRITGNSGTNSAVSLGTFSPTSGKWYWEVTQGSLASEFIGVMTKTVTGESLIDGSALAQTLGKGVVARYNGAVRGISGELQLTTTSTWTTGDIIQLAVDLDNGAVYYGKNGTWLNSGVPTSGSSKTGSFLNFTQDGTRCCTPACDAFNGGYVDANFGQRPFTYTPPTGFKALNTQNLTDGSTIKAGNKYMNAVTWTGNGASSRSFTGWGFAPDFIWMKNRSAAADNALIDSVRGTGAKVLISNTTDAEVSYGLSVTSFDADGFTGATGSLNFSYANNNTQAYVGWGWKKGATPGFDIVTYTGTGVARTISHSLGVAPKMMIVKPRGTGSWIVYHTGLGSNDKYTVLDGTADPYSPASTVWNSTAPTLSVFSVGTASGVNTNTATYVAYLWAEVAGFSKFGSYTGNGSTDGPFVYLGFRPRFIMIKRTDTSSNWVMWDTARDTYNAGGFGLYPNLPAAEDDYRVSNPDDILSNGFKPRANYANVNASGGTYIYAAFAENPFKYSLAR